MHNRCLTLLLLLMTIQSWAKAPLKVRWENFEKSREEYLLTLVTTVADCVVRNDTLHPVFHGCFDWHSAAHGYWALLRAHRLKANPQHLAIVERAFTNEAMAQELEFLRQNNDFEMPYGRAWFLLLIKELEETTGDKRFQTFADFVAETLHQYLIRQPFKATSDQYRNHAWAYVRLLDYYRFRKQQSKFKSIADNINIVSIQPTSLNADKRSVFFSRWSNLAHLLSHIMSPKEMLVWEANHRQDADLLLPISTYRGDHQLAINFSRAWGFWSLYTKTNQSVYLDAYLSHIEQGFLLHTTYKNNYRSYGHWVPQFAIYAMSISDPLINSRQAVRLCN